MNKNIKHEEELEKIGKRIETIYNESKEDTTFKILDKIVDKFCDPIDQYGIMYLSDCVLYMNTNWANDFLKEVDTYYKSFKEAIENHTFCR